MRPEQNMTRDEEYELHARPENQEPQGPARRRRLVERELDPDRTRTCAGALAGSRRSRTARSSGRPGESGYSSWSTDVELDIDAGSSRSSRRSRWIPSRSFWGRSRRITYTYSSRRTKGRSWSQRVSRSRSCGEVDEPERSCRPGWLIAT
jgi:hypothetical protein